MRENEVKLPEVLINDFDSITNYGYFVHVKPLGYEVVLILSPFALLRLVRVAQKQHIVSGDIKYPTKYINSRGVLINDT